MFHHGVWLNLSTQDAAPAATLPERFFAIGEEKTDPDAAAGLRLSPSATDTGC